MGYRVSSLPQALLRRAYLPRGLRPSPVVALLSPNKRPIPAEIGRPARSAYLAQDRLTTFGRPIVGGKGAGLAPQRY